MSEVADKHSKAWTWVANTFLIGGGVAISISPKVGLDYTVFLFFLVGHIIWSAFAIFRKERDLMFLNIGFAMLDSYAVLIRLPS